MKDKAGDGRGGAFFMTFEDVLLDVKSSCVSPQCFFFLISLFEVVMAVIGGSAGSVVSASAGLSMFDGSAGGGVVARVAAAVDSVVAVAASGRGVDCTPIVSSSVTAGSTGPDTGPSTWAAAATAPSLVVAAPPLEADTAASYSFPRASFLARKTGSHNRLRSFKAVSISLTSLSTAIPTGSLRPSNMMVTASTGPGSRVMPCKLNARSGRGRPASV